MFEEFVEIRRKIHLSCNSRSSTVPNLLLSAALLSSVTLQPIYVPLLFKNIQVFGYETIKYQQGTELFIALSVLPRVGVQGITNLDCYTVGDFMFSYIQHGRLWWYL